MDKSLWQKLIFCTVLLISYSSYSQSTNNVFKSQVDEDISLPRVTLFPITDNAEGIYSKPLFEKMSEYLQAQHRWDYVPANLVGNPPSPLDLEEDSAATKKIFENIDAQGIFVAKVTKGPKGISITLNLFLKKDGLLFVQETLKDHPHFDLKEIQAQGIKLMGRAIERVPYSGIVQSRFGNKVTLNLGAKDGIKPQQIVSSVLFLNLTRHPKFNFFINSEKEVLGKIKIEKVDDTLSFGSIIYEKEKGVIQKSAKIIGTNITNYNVAEGSESSPASEVPYDNSANKISFGENPQEWVPVSPPTFGKVGFKFGMGSFIANTTLSTAGSVKAQSSIFPSLRLDGELWITQNWIVDARIQQGVMAVDNPTAGSNPASLNVSMSRYDLGFGYNFLIRDDFFGPKIQFNMGFSQYNFFVDASTPLAITSANYSGLNFGILGFFPITEDKSIDAGVALQLFLKPSLSETPQTSGASSENSVTNFSIFGSKRLSEKIRAVGSLDFDLYSSTFSGSGTRADAGLNASQRVTVLSGGIEYLF